MDEMTDEERWQLFPIILSEHKPVWEKNYVKEKSVLEKAVGSGYFIRISHIGSTAIHGLIAKPTIDVLVEIKEGTNLARFIYNMQRAEYKYIEHPENPPPHMMFVKGYTPEGFKGQVFHVHVRYGGDWDELYFRDYLLTHPEAAEEYGRLKLELKQKYEHNRDAYTNAKTDFIKRICRLARAEIKNDKQYQ